MVMSVTNMLIAISVLLLVKEESNVVGALVVSLTTRVLVQPHSNVVVSKLELLMLSLAQLISEQLTAKVIHVILVPQNAQSVMMVNSQISHHALMFAKQKSHSPNATQKPKSAKKNASREIQTATTEISAMSIVKHQNQNAMVLLVNAKIVTKLLIQTAHK